MMVDNNFTSKANVSVAVKTCGTKEDCQNSGVLDFECSVCLQNCIHPVQLPCKHIFCFLCVKGVANRSKRCALCRQEISPDYFLRPKLVRQEDLEKTIKFENKYQWFYEGRNGWWQYDDRTSQDIELKYKNGEKVFELLIAGFIYAIDLESMIQYRRNDRSKKRNIKRDVININEVKGVAGLKYNASVEDRPGGDGLEQRNQSANQNAAIPASSNMSDDLPSPLAPSNTPQTPQTPAASPSSSTSGSLQDLSAHLHNLHINDTELHSAARSNEPISSPSSSASISRPIPQVQSPDNDGEVNLSSEVPVASSSGALETNGDSAQANNHRHSHSDDRPCLVCSGSSQASQAGNSPPATNSSVNVRSRVTNVEGDQGTEV